MFATSRKNLEDAQEVVRKRLPKWYVAALLEVLHTVIPASHAQLKAVVSSNFSFLTNLKFPGEDHIHINLFDQFF